MFQQLLREDLIRVPLEATNCEGAMAELIAMLPSGMLSPRQKGNLLEILLQQEFFESTAAGNQLALSHCVLPGLTEPFLLAGVSRKGIEYRSGDGQPAHFVLLSVFPETVPFSQRSAHLLEIQAFFRDPFLRERMKISETPEEIYEIMLRESQPAFSAPRYKYRA